MYTGEAMDYVAPTKAHEVTLNKIKTTYLLRVVGELPIGKISGVARGNLGRYMGALQILVFSDTHAGVYGDDRSERWSCDLAELECTNMFGLLLAREGDEPVQFSTGQSRRNGRIARHAEAARAAREAALAAGAPRDRARVWPMWVAGTTGLNLERQSLVRVELSADVLRIHDDGTTAVLAEASGRAVQKVDAAGPGDYREGGGFFRPGLGLSDPDAAGTLATLTDRYEMQSVVRIRTDAWTALLVSQTLTPAEVSAFAPAGASGDSAETRAAPESDAPSVAQQLTQLAGLHASGVLTDEEFSAAKARLLG